jgi:hypothetical protein
VLKSTAAAAEAAAAIPLAITADLSAMKWAMSVNSTQALAAMVADDLTSGFSMLLATPDVISERQINFDTKSHFIAKPLNSKYLIA